MRVIDFRGDAHHGLAGSENLVEHALRFFLEVVLKVGTGLALLVGDLAARRAGRIIGIGHGVAGAVDHGDVLGLEPLHAVGDEESGWLEAGCC